MMDNEVESEETVPEKCVCCGRTVEMMDILNQYFTRDLTLKQIGLYVESLCSECVKELQQITFEQVYYGDPRMKSRDLQDKCVSILFNREHPEVVIDVELCSLLTFFQDKINELKHRERFSSEELRVYIYSSMHEWNMTHKHKCNVSIEPMDALGSKLLIWIRLMIGPSRSEGFSVHLELNTQMPGIGSNDIIPFKVD